MSIGMAQSSLSIVEMRSRYAAGERDFQDLDLSETALDREDLVGVNLKGTRLERGRFRGANLMNAYLADANLRCADLRGAKLTDACLSDADLQGASLESAELSGANLQGANLKSANLRGAHLRGANLNGADLRDANLQDTNLRHMDLRKADLRGAFLGDADLFGADLRGARLADASLQSAELDGANLQGADLCRADCANANLARANLEGCDMRGVSLIDANLEGAQLARARLRGANLEGADLRGVDVRGVNLSQTVLCGAKIDAATLNRGVLGRLRGVTRGLLRMMMLLGFAAQLAWSLWALAQHVEFDPSSIHSYDAGALVMCVGLPILLLAIRTTRVGPASRRGTVARYLPSSWTARQSLAEGLVASLLAATGVGAALIFSLPLLAPLAALGVLAGMWIGHAGFRHFSINQVTRAQLCDLRTRQRRWRRELRQQVQRNGGTSVELSEASRGADTRIDLLDQHIQVLDLGGVVNVAGLLAAVGQNNDRLPAQLTIPVRSPRSNTACW